MTREEIRGQEESGGSQGNVNDEDAEGDLRVELAHESAGQFLTCGEEWAMYSHLIWRTLTEEISTRIIEI